MLLLWIDQIIVDPQFTLGTILATGNAGSGDPGAFRQEGNGSWCFGSAPELDFLSQPAAKTPRAAGARSQSSVIDAERRKLLDNFGFCRRDIARPA